MMLGFSANSSRVSGQTPTHWGKAVRPTQCEPSRQCPSWPVARQNVAAEAPDIGGGRTHPEDAWEEAERWDGMS